jgi:hypothetical protein
VKRISFNYPLVTPVYRVFLVFVFAIFSGGLIYILLRPAEPVFFEWFTSVCLEILAGIAFGIKTNKINSYEKDMV